MLTVYYGTDLIALQDALLAYVDSCKENNAGLEVIRIEAEQYETGLVKNLTSTVSLFDSVRLYIFDNPSQKIELSEEIFAEVKTLGEAKDHFMVVEKNLLAAQKKILLPHALIIKEYKKEARNVFNPFAMAEALALKDKRTLWLLLTQARQHNLSAEEIIGVLWWQLKILRLAILTSSATEAGVKDYPYNKAKRAVTQFNKGQVEALGVSLLKLYHAGHSGKRDIDDALEEWVLKSL